MGKRKRKPSFSGKIKEIISELTGLTGTRLESKTNMLRKELKDDKDVLPYIPPTDGEGPARRYHIPDEEGLEAILRTKISSREDIKKLAGTKQEREALRTGEDAKELSEIVGQSHEEDKKAHSFYGIVKELVIEELHLEGKKLVYKVRTLIRKYRKDDEVKPHTSPIDEKTCKEKPGKRYDVLNPHALRSVLRKKIRQEAAVRKRIRRRPLGSAKAGSGFYKIMKKVLMEELRLGGRELPLMVRKLTRQYSRYQRIRDCFSTEGSEVIDAELLEGELRSIVRAPRNRTSYGLILVDGKVPLDRVLSDIEEEGFRHESFEAMQSLDERYTNGKTAIIVHEKGSHVIADYSGGVSSSDAPNLVEEYGLSGIDYMLVIRNDSGDPDENIATEIIKVAESIGERLRKNSIDIIAVNGLLNSEIVYDSR